MERGETMVECDFLYTENTLFCLWKKQIPNKVQLYEREVEWIDEGIIYTTKNMDVIISKHQNVYIPGIDGFGGGYSRENKYLLKHKTKNTFFYLYIWDDERCDTHIQISNVEAKTLYLKWQRFEDNYAPHNLKTNIYKSFEEAFGQKIPEIY
jgi:hypothetical protein